VAPAGRLALLAGLGAWGPPLALGFGVMGVAASLFWGVRVLEADAHYMRGALGGGTPSAVAELTRATTAMPLLETYWTALGIAQLRVGGAQEDAALAQEGFGSLNRALRIAPRDVDALDALARAYLNERNWDAARVTAAQAVSFAPVEPAGHADLSYALLKTGDRAGALREARLAVVADTGNPRVYYVVGLTYRDAGEVAQARQMLQKALALSPGFTQARQALDGLPAS
jgi:Flp pilus assembly protein TadD